MERQINRIKVFPNDNDQAKSIELETLQLLKKYHFEIVDHDYDLAIAIGGDGAFIRMLKENNFNTDIYYVGINAGTLGFLQEIKPSEIELFIARLNNNDFIKEKISVQKTTVTMKDGAIDDFLSLNEIVIRCKDLNTIHLNIIVDNTILEKFVGDGILVSTSIGSTAYNLSFGGSIVYSDLHTLQITPIAPLNSKAYHSLINSVIVPENKTIEIVPSLKNELLLMYDGTNKCYHDVTSIITKVDKKKITCLRMNNYSYSTIINEKFLN